MSGASKWLAQSHTLFFSWSGYSYIGLSFCWPSFMTWSPLFPSISTFSVFCSNWLFWWSSSWMYAWFHENPLPCCLGWHCLPCPRFQCGRPAYFDVSVHCTTQPSYISSISPCAGVAVAAGRWTRTRNIKMLWRRQGVFIPLMVETSGVWSPFALRMLQTIVNCTTTRCGTFTKLARSHFLEQFSPCLCEPRTSQLYISVCDDCICYVCVIS